MLRKRLGVRAYLFLFLSALTAAPVVWLGASQVRRSVSVTRAEMALDERARCLAIAREVESQVQNEIRAVELLAGLIEIIGLTNRQQVQRILAKFRENYPEFGFTYVAGKDGVSVVTDPEEDNHGNKHAGVDYSDRDYYRKLTETGRTAISAVQRGRRSGVLNIQVVAPIRNEAGEMVAFAEGSVDLSTIQRAAQETKAQSPSIQVVVVDDRSQIIADSRRSSNDQLVDVSRYDLFAPAKTTQSVARSTVDEKGREIRGAAVAIPVLSTQWTALVFRPQADVQVQASLARRQTVLVTVLALAVALVFAALLSTLLASPIRRLAAAVALVGDGKFPVESPQPKNWEPREVADLLESVSQMFSRLRQHSESAMLHAKKLADMNDRMRPLAEGLEQSGDAITVGDADAVLEYVNPAFEKLTGYSIHEATGKTPAQLIRSDKHPSAFYDDIWNSLRQEGRWFGKMTSRRKDGSLFEEEVTISAVLDSTGNLTNIVSVHRDMTGRNKAEATLRLGERMASIGTLAAGLAHEINNPLAYVGANLTYIMETIEMHRSFFESETAKDMLLAIRDATEGVERIDDIVCSMRTFSRGDEQKIGPVDIHRVLDSCAKMAHNEIFHRAQLTREYGATLRVLGNEARLGQVFLNLIVNAAHAIPVGEAENNEIRMTTTTTSDGRVSVAIRDTGEGIKQDVLARIFDPFFTTKPVGIGTGLGLSICHSILTGMGGVILAESSVGEGTTFTVILPSVSNEKKTAVDIRTPSKVGSTSAI